MANIGISDDRTPAGKTLRVWHVPQIPCPPFYVVVGTVDEAMLIISTLARYDAFQFDTHIKPDYCNASGLEEYDAQSDSWPEWQNDNGEDIAEVLLGQVK